MLLCVTVRMLVGVSCCCLRFFEDISLWRGQSGTTVWCYSSPPTLLKHLVQRKGNGCCDISYCRNLACKYALECYKPQWADSVPYPVPRPKGPAGLHFRNSWDEVITLKSNAFPQTSVGWDFQLPSFLKYKNLFLLMDSLCGEARINIWGTFMTQKKTPNVPTPSKILVWNIYICIYVYISLMNLIVWGLFRGSRALNSYWCKLWQGMVGVSWDHLSSDSERTLKDYFWRDMLFNVISSDIPELCVDQSKNSIQKPQNRPQNTQNRFHW